MSAGGSLLPLVFCGFMAGALVDRKLRPEGCESVTNLLLKDDGKNVVYGQGGNCNVEL